MHKPEFFQIVFKKHCIIQYALFESHRKNIFRAFAELNALQLAIIENHFGIHCIVHFAHGQIAAEKFTRFEVEFAQILTRKAAILKGTVYKIVIVQNRSAGDGFVGSH
jgi:hypothetical protein